MAQKIETQESYAALLAENMKIPRDEFIARFKARMLERTPFERFVEEDGTDGGSVAEYADQTAPTYWEEEDQRKEGPEECADADMSYWGE